MQDPDASFDLEAVRRAWDAAADSFTRGQASGRDFYRYEFFGPAQAELCGDVSGVRVLDLGCGSGYFAREMARRGAEVTGVDVSPRLIEHAERIERDESLGIRYVKADAADLSGVIPDISFEMVTSCVALQDMPDVPGVLREVRRVLRPDGRFVVSITHPCTDMPFREWERDATGAKRWLCLDRYFERGPLTYTWKRWPSDFSTRAMHATLEDWFGWFLGSGLVLTDLREPRPSQEVLKLRPALDDAARVPYYLLFDFTSPAER